MWPGDKPWNHEGLSGVKTLGLFSRPVMLSLTWQQPLGTPPAPSGSAVKGSRGREQTSLVRGKNSLMSLDSEALLCGGRPPVSHFTGSALLWLLPSV